MVTSVPVSASSCHCASSDKTTRGVSQPGWRHETQDVSISSPRGVHAGGLKRTHHITSYVHRSLDKYTLRAETTYSAPLQARSEVRQCVWGGALCGRDRGQAQMHKALILERAHEHHPECPRASVQPVHVGRATTTRPELRGGLSRERHGQAPVFTGLSFWKMPWILVNVVIPFFSFFFFFKKLVYLLSL